MTSRTDDWTRGRPQLLLDSCDQCGQYRYLPRLRCEACGSPDTTLVTAGEDDGVCVAFSELLVAADRGEPLRLALVELAEGPIAMTRADPDVRVGDRVRVHFEDFAGALLPVAARKGLGCSTSSTTRHPSR